MNINSLYNHPVKPYEDRNPFFSYKNKTKATLASVTRSATEQTAGSGLSGTNILYPMEKILRKGATYFAGNILAISKAFNNDEDLTHPDIFNFLEGCCYGLSACYILFNILGRSDIFNQLLNILQENPEQGWRFYNKRYDTLSKAITDAQIKDKNNPNTDDDTQLLLNLRPFLELLAAIQSPKFTVLAKEIPRQNMQQVIAYISAENLDGIPIIKSSPLCIAALKTDGLQQFLTQLSAGINTDVPGRLFSISSIGHTVAVKITSDGYEFFNINQINYKKNFAHGTEAELTSTLQQAMDLTPHKTINPRNGILLIMQEFCAPANYVYLQQDKHSIQHLCSEVPAEHLFDINQICPYSKVTQLYVACMEDNIKIVKTLLSASDIDVNKAGPNDRTPLHIACEIGNIEIVEALLSIKNIEVDKTMSCGRTPLYIACEKGNIKIVKKLLLAQNINVNQTMPGGGTPLYKACEIGNIEIVTTLLEAQNIDVNTTMSSGRTPLYKACEIGNIEIVAALLEKQNIEANQTMPCGRTPLYIACEKGNIEIVKKLLLPQSINMNVNVNVNVNQTMPSGRAPLHKACETGNVEIVKKLLEARNIKINKTMSCGRTPLHIACEKGNIKIVKKLLSAQNIEANKTMPCGRTPLHIACEEGNVEIVKALLSAKNIDINKTMLCGRTPLCIACEEKKCEITRLLLTKNTEPDQEEPLSKRPRLDCC